MTRLSERYKSLHAQDRPAVVELHADIKRLEADLARVEGEREPSGTSRKEPIMTTNAQTTHTPAGGWTQLVAKDNRVHFGKGGPELAVVTKSDPLMRQHADAVAAEIVRRWNAYPDLLAAVQAYREAVNSGIESDPALWANAARLGDAAIAKAKGGAA